MNTTELVRGQYQMLFQFLDMTMADCTSEVAAKHDDGWTIHPIGTIYLHVAISADTSMSGMSGAEQTILVRDGWDKKLGVDSPESRQTEDSGDFVPDIAIAREYTAAVAKGVDEFFAAATDDQMNAEMDGPLGKSTVIEVLANIGVTHIASHWGEIAALKGVQGQKGLPF
jgi:hypothetical protein